MRRLGQYVLAFLREKKVTLKLASPEQFLQFVLDDKSRSKQTLIQWLTAPISFEALLFLHTLSMVSSQPKRNSMNVNMSYKTGNEVALVVQSVSGP